MKQTIKRLITAGLLTALLFTACITGIDPGNWAMKGVSMDEAPAHMQVIYKSYDNRINNSPDLLAD